MQDYFSNQSAIYAKYRPKYPEELFEFISSLCRERKLAWDCATGNGQAAFSISKYFKKVIATDSSESQISNSFPNKRIEYKIEKGEHCSLENNSADLITVATASHWLNLDEFYAQVNRVLKPGGLLALWSYAGCNISQETDKILHSFAHDFLGNYWPTEASANWKYRYELLPFPYELIPAPAFKAQAEYRFPDLLNYLFSWSSVQQFIRRHQKNPVDMIREDLRSAWGNPDNTKPVTWDLFLKCGLKPEIKN